MKISAGVPTYASTDFRFPSDRLFEYARAAESYEFSGLWAIEHLVTPPTYATSWYDPLTALATIAGETNSIQLGTSILNLPLRNPVLVAQRAATIHALTGGRLTLGLGTGYLPSEFDAVDVPFDERSKRFREGVELMRRLFTEETVTFDGEFYSVESFSLEPAVGNPPKLLTAGEGAERESGRTVAKTVLDRLDHADGWISPPRAMETLQSDWADFSDHLESTGRDPSSVHRVGLQYLHMVPNVDESVATEKQDRVFERITGESDPRVDQMQDFEQNWLYGDTDAIVDRIGGYADAGFDELILHPVTPDPSELDHQLRLWRDRVLPVFSCAGPPFAVSTDR